MYPTLTHLIRDLTGYSVHLPLQTFGMFVALAFLLAALILKLELKRKEKEGIIHSVFNKKGDSIRPHDQVFNIILIAGISGVIGARLFSILEYPADFLNAPLQTLFSNSGLTYYGGLIFGTVAVIIYARKIDLRIKHLADAAAPGLMLSYAIGRIGCHLAGDGDWGIDNLSPKPTWMNFFPDWAWAYRYPHNVIMEGIPIKGCNDTYCTILQNPVFPTPLYEVIICIFFFLLIWIFRKKIKTGGVLFSIYLILNGIERIFIEKIRIDSQFKILGVWMKQAELIAFVTIIFGILLFMYLTINSKKTEIEN